MSYCDPDDLLTGDMTTSNNARTQFTNLASDEMDAVLAQVFQVPLLPIPPAAALTDYALLNLKNCNRLIASGRLVMDRAMVAENDNLHAYGKSLYDEGMLMLMSMRSGAIDLGALKVVTLQTDGDGPATVNADASSGVDAFYEFTSRPSLLDVWSPGWHPGS